MGKGMKEGRKKGKEGGGLEERKEGKKECRKKGKKAGRLEEGNGEEGKDGAAEEC